MEIALPVVQPLAPRGAPHLVEVAFKGTRRGFYISADEELKEGEYVLVAAERGQDLGRVRSRGGVAVSKCTASGASATLRVLRVADPSEVRQAMVLRADEERVRRQTRELVERHGLKMKVSDAEWQWDRNKLTIYFTAERRVDFRELVRDLARTFRTRIELKQIGVRDEAALLGGVGRCGRQLCCATWLREIKPVSLQLAKDQNLSLNPSQISGTCGRLMCCLTYEHDAYLQARKRFPREGKLIRTQQGQERVIGIDIWRDTVTLMDESRQRRTIPLAELKKETTAAIAPRPEGSDTEPAAASPAAGRAEADATDDNGAVRTNRSAAATAVPQGERQPQPGNGRRKRPNRGGKRNASRVEAPAPSSETGSVDAAAEANGQPRRQRRRGGRRRGGGQQ